MRWNHSGTTGQYPVSGRLLAEKALGLDHRQAALCPGYEDPFRGLYGQRRGVARIRNPHYHNGICGAGQRLSGRTWASRSALAPRPGAGRAAQAVTFHLDQLSGGRSPLPPGRQDQKQETRAPADQSRAGRGSRRPELREAARGSPVGRGGRRHMARAETRSPPRWHSAQDRGGPRDLAQSAEELHKHSGGRWQRREDVYDSCAAHRRRP